MSQNTLTKSSVFHRINYSIDEPRTDSALLSGLKYGFAEGGYTGSVWKLIGDLVKPASDATNSYAVAFDSTTNLSFNKDQKLAILTWAHDYMTKNSQDLDPEISKLINDNFFDLIG